MEIRQSARTIRTVGRQPARADRTECIAVLKFRTLRQNTDPGTRSDIFARSRRMDFMEKGMENETPDEQQSQQDQIPFSVSFPHGRYPLFERPQYKPPVPIFQGIFKKNPAFCLKDMKNGVKYLNSGLGKNRRTGSCRQI